jgi:hypothetical protein
VCLISSISMIQKNHSYAVKSSEKIYLFYMSAKNGVAQLCKKPTFFLK